MSALCFVSCSGVLATQMTELDKTHSAEPEAAGAGHLSLGKKILFACVPLLLLYAASETVLSAMDFAPFTPSPENVPIGKRAVQSPWGDVRQVTDQIFIGAHASFEMPFYFRAFVPPPRPKPAGLKRIVFLGDSFFFGSGISDHETLPFQLSGYFGYLKPEQPVEMINLGVNGGGARTYFALREVADRYDPDLVVVGFTTANDFTLGNNQPAEILAAEHDTSLAPPVTEDIPVNGEFVDKELRGFIGALQAGRDVILPRSRTLSAMFRPIRKLELGKRWDAYMERTYSKNNEAVFAYLDSLSNHYTERGVPHVLLIYPFLFSTRNIGINDVDGYRYAEYHDSVRAFAGKTNFHVIDVIDYFRRDGVSSFDGYQVDGDGHPNGAFNALLARHLSADLLEWSFP